MLHYMTFFSVMSMLGCKRMKHMLPIALSYCNGSRMRPSFGKPRANNAPLNNNVSCLVE